MQAAIKQYIAELNRLFRAGNATEHSYRPALQRLLECIFSLPSGKLQVTNEPRRIACGAPDYIITRADIPVGYFEAKDIGTDFNRKDVKEQVNRYKQSLANLITTDYLNFKWYVNGTPEFETCIGSVTDNGIVAYPDNFDKFVEMMNGFALFNLVNIKSAEQLSKIMAAKARLMANIIETAVIETSTSSHRNALENQLNSFRKHLLPNLKEKEFSDIYAQTIAYGMFAAKLNLSDDTINSNFNRSIAANYIPHSNPFLRKLFHDIAGFDLDERIRWVVDELADLFNHVDIISIIREFAIQDHDPIVHFYETFLSHYDPALRKSRGVWYTPQPVVRFIVQAVDNILKADFNIPQGLADNSFVQTSPAASLKYHRVQILDPAAGTGTFLAEVVRNIYSRFASMQGVWQSYASQHLIPRVNGFEILMASYAMAHLKLDMLLKQTGYHHAGDERLHIYLTNSLDEARSNTEIPFAQWLEDEANEASHIKRDVPVMVVLGNPPYSVSSQNKSKWINDLMAVYKQGLNEKNIQPLSDDYIKFIRFGQYFIDKNGEGILAFISNNSFIDGIIHRQMRKNLLMSFDKIFILNLHGSSKKKETAPDGGADENVFDIQQGVSINIFVKSNRRHCGSSPQSPDFAYVFHADLFGKRDEKYSFLLNNNIQSIKWNKLNFDADNFFFVPKDFTLKVEYDKGFKIDELFEMYSSGIKTQRDDASIKFSQSECYAIKDDFLNLSNIDLNKKYGFVDVRDWSISNARNDLKANEIIFNKLLYRPFDFRFMNYTGKTKGVMGYPRFAIMKHFICGENIGLLTCRQQSSFDYQHIFVSHVITDMCSVSLQTKETTYIFPLYLYPDDNALLSDTTRKPNFNPSIVNEFSNLLGLQFSPEPSSPNSQLPAPNFSPFDIFDYIYAVLHSPAYRERYKEFLKIDFPRVPYPLNVGQFWQLVSLGAKLRSLHLMNNVSPQDDIATFPKEGSNEIVKIHYIGQSKIENQQSKIYINDTQYFENVPPEAWNFYIGGYQPAQKWLKDRKGRTLNFDDVSHYRNIIRILLETGEIMQQIDNHL